MLMQGLAAWMEPLEDVLLVIVAVTVQEFIDAKCAVDVVLLDLNLRDDSQPAQNVRRVLDSDAAAGTLEVSPELVFLLSTGSKHR
ncbi:hypothetical protein AAFM46_15775 [Arthrobacter sp. TMP15]|uniref:hypothetical protein n=1 Tax=Arthrobacter sp. TMP15 TaxID=3140789 RepID=UPI0031BB7B03